MKISPPSSLHLRDHPVNCERKKKPFIAFLVALSNLELWDWKCAEMAGHQRPSIAMRSLFLLAALVPITAAQSGTVTCFGFNGGNYTGNIPCPGSNACCGSGATCLSNRVCVNPNGELVRPPCRVFPFDETCSQICLFGELFSSKKPSTRRPTTNPLTQTSHPPADSSRALKSATTAASAAPTTRPAANAASVSSSTRAGNG
jgi:hypothetical protein